MDMDPKRLQRIERRFHGVLLRHMGEIFAGENFAYLDKEKTFAQLGVDAEDMVGIIDGLEKAFGIELANQPVSQATGQYIGERVVVADCFALVLRMVEEAGVLPEFSCVPDVPAPAPTAGGPMTLFLEKMEFTPAQCVLCPACGNDYVHHLSATILVNGRDDYQAHPEVRGDVIVIPAWCESGHKFNVLLGFHKGRTLAWTEIRKGTLPGDFDAPNPATSQSPADAPL